MSDITQPDFILSLFLTAVIGGGIGGMLSAVWNAVVSRRFEVSKASSRVENESQKVAPRQACKRWFTKI